jgi:hypothetical protein
MDPMMMGGMDPMMMGGMDPMMMGGMDPMMGGMDPGMMGMQMGMDPGQMYGNEFMNPGEGNEFFGEGNEFFGEGYEFFGEGNEFFGEGNEFFGEGYEFFGEGNEFYGEGNEFYGEGNEFYGEGNEFFREGNEFFEEEEENEMFGPWYWGGVQYNNYLDYKNATFYNGIYYLPEENGAYGDPVSAYNAYLAAQSGPPQPAEIATAGDDTLYTSGSSGSVGNLGTLTAFDLLTGNDTIGVPNNDVGGLTGSDFIKGNDGNDNMYGGGGSDVLKGGDGNDKLFGGFGNDILIGGDGSDIIESGAHSMGDIMYGGDVNDGDILSASNPGYGGATSDGAQDTFVFMIGQGLANPSFIDLIGDFEDGTDKLAISDDNGTTWLTNAFSVGNPGGGGLLSVGQSGGMTMVYKYDNSEFLFSMNGTITLDDTDLVTNPYA